MDDGDITEQQVREQLAIAHLAHHQWHLQGLAHDIGMAVDQVIEHHRLVAGPAQGPYRLAADVARTARDQNPQSLNSTPACRLEM